jgi:hypothetical protein
MNPIRSILNSCSTYRATMVPLALLGAAGLSQASVTSPNLLVDHEFEVQPSMGNYASVVTNFTSTSGVWATENGVFVGADSGVTPVVSRMLKMAKGSGVTTSSIQMISLASFASQIATGTATFNMSALFNTSSISGTQGGGIFTEFFAGPTDWGTPLGSSVSTSKILDTSLTTWEQIAQGGSIPVGAGWAGVQVLFGNANLGDNAGYVDGLSVAGVATGFTVTTIPEPSGTMLLGLGASVLLLRRRK